MAGQPVVIHDARLVGDSPTGVTVVHVNQNYPLERMVREVNNIAFQYGGDVRVKILAHGYEDTNGRGGYGIQLCREDLTLDTVNRLAPWRNNLSFGITIYSCAAADCAPGHEGGIGDGRMLCSRIAQVTATGVRAADATQVYRHFNLLNIIRMPIDFGAWEGNVLEFDARGALVSVQHSPQQ